MPERVIASGSIASYPTYVDEAFLWMPSVGSSLVEDYDLEGGFIYTAEMFSYDVNDAGDSFTWVVTEPVCDGLPFTFYGRSYAPSVGSCTSLLAGCLGAVKANNRLYVRRFKSSDGTVLETQLEDSATSGGLVRVTGFRLLMMFRGGWFPVAEDFGYDANFTWKPYKDGQLIGSGSGLDYGPSEDPNITCPGESSIQPAWEDLDTQTDQPHFGLGGKTSSYFDEEFGLYFTYVDGTGYGVPSVSHFHRGMRLTTYWQEVDHYTQIWMPLVGYEDQTPSPVDAALNAGRALKTIGWTSKDEALSCDGVDAEAEEVWECEYCGTTYSSNNSPGDTCPDCSGRVLSTNFLALDKFNLESVFPVGRQCAGMDLRVIGHLYFSGALSEDLVLRVQPRTSQGVVGEVSSATAERMSVDTNGEQFDYTFGGVYQGGGWSDPTDVYLTGDGSLPFTRCTMVDDGFGFNISAYEPTGANIDNGTFWVDCVWVTLYLWPEN